VESEEIHRKCYHSHKFCPPVPNQKSEDDKEPFWSQLLSIVSHATALNKSNQHLQISTAISTTLPVSNHYSLAAKNSYPNVVL